jgi:diacylglycerol kinase
MKEKFRPALQGLADALHDQGCRTQMILAALALCAGFVLKLSAIEWLAVVICIGMVITAEILNTAIEKVCDLISKENDERIRLIKDLSAGAVLVSALTALICSLVILFQHI